MQYRVPPFAHQLNAIEIAKSKRDLALFWEMGTGKTAAIINILRHKFAETKSVRRTLILSPLVTLRNWKDEFGVHSNIKTQDIVVLGGSGRKRLQDFDKYALNQNKIVIMNYDFMQNGEIVSRLLEWAPDILVADESHLIKNHSSKRAKNVAMISDICKHRFILTGTPILNSPLDLYMQFRVLDGGETFGKNFFTFRARYFEDVNSRWAQRPGYFPKWEPRPDKFGEMNELIYSKAIRVIKKECLDLPPLVTENLEVDMSPEQRRVYNEMKRDFVAFIESSGEAKAVVAQIALTKALRLQQIVSGHVTTDDGELITFDNIPRLQVLEDLLSQIAVDNKVIVWCAFSHDYLQVERVCKKLGLLYSFLTGEQSQKEKDFSILEFRKNPGVKVLIANRRAGGIGINLIEASYSIVYSRNFSLGDELQSEARNYRSGSEQHVKITKINLVAKDSIDAVVLNRLQLKQEISASIIDLVKDI